MMQRSRVVTYILAHFIDVSIERECTIDGDAETLNAFSYSDQVDAECTSIDCTFHSMRALVPMTITSDLSGFSDKPFSANQFLTATKQCSNCIAYKIDLCEKLKSNVYT